MTNRKRYWAPIKSRFGNFAAWVDGEGKLTRFDLRAKGAEPFVSMPVTWEELRKAVKRGDAKPLFFTPAAAIKRLSRVGDLFATHVVSDATDYRYAANAGLARTTVEARAVISTKIEIDAIAYKPEKA